MGASEVDPGRVVFVNENLGGHASMHLFLRDALAEVHPGLDAEFVDVPSAGNAATRPRRPAAGARSARSRPSPTAPPARAEQGCASARAPHGHVVRPARRPAHVHAEHRAAQRRDAPGVPVRRLDRCHVAPGCVPSAPSPPDPLHLVGSARRPGLRTSCVRGGNAARRAVGVGGRLAAPGLWRRRRPHPGDPVRTDARSRAGPPGAGRAPRGHLRRRHARPQGWMAAAAGLPGAPPGPLRPQPRHARRGRPRARRPRPERLRARGSTAARTSWPARPSSPSRPRWTTRRTRCSRRCARASRSSRPASAHCPRWSTTV